MTVHADSGVSETLTDTVSTNGEFNPGDSATWSQSPPRFTATIKGAFTTNGHSYPVFYDPDTGAYIAMGLNRTATGIFTAASFNPPCYVAGTLILTTDGDVAIETLRVGDRVVTASGQTKPIKWIGHRQTYCRRHPHPDRVWPVRIQAGAFGEGMPARDLYLSPDHAVFAKGVLIPVKHLVNGATIVQAPRKRVTYYHVELDSHDVILAEGLPCESYLDNGTRTAFANGGGIVQLHPDFSPAERCEAIGEAAACAPLRIEGEAFARADAALRRRAVALGYAASEAAPRPAAPAARSADLIGLLQPEWYLAANPDVAAAGIDARAHYVAAGRREGRLPCPEADLISGLGLIDPATVARTMPDVVLAGADLAQHFCQHGWREGRRPNAYFDPAWYLDTHDVPAGMNPLVQYVLFGEPAGLAPSRHFDPAWYRRLHALAPSVCALAHYLLHRRTQRFSPLPSFDVASYIQAQTLPPQRDPYAHFLAIGRFAAAADMQRAA
jgi:hypothetical protein